MNAAPATNQKEAPQRAKALLSRQEFCSLVSISISTFERLVARGGVDIVHIGRKVLVPSTQIDRLAKSRSIATGVHGNGHHTHAA